MRSGVRKILLGIVVLIVAVVGAAGYILIRGANDLSGPVKNRLETLVGIGSDGLYKLSIGELRVSIRNNLVEATDITLAVDSVRYKQLDSLDALPDDVLAISLSLVSIEGIKPKTLLSRTISLKQISIGDSDVHIYHNKQEYNQRVKDTRGLYSRLAKEVGSFSASDVQVSNLKMTYHDQDKHFERANKGNVSLHFRDILIDSTTQYDTTRFLFARDALITITEYGLQTSDGLYDFMIDSLILDADGRDMRLQGLRLKPRFAPDVFFRQLQYFDNRFDIHCVNAELRDVEWYDLWANASFVANHMVLRGLEFEVRDDRRLDLPRRNKIGKYPHQLLAQLACSDRN